MGKNGQPKPAPQPQRPQQVYPVPIERPTNKNLIGQVQKGQKPGGEQRGSEKSR